jgi:hypothetical protein
VAQWQSWTIARRRFLVTHARHDRARLWGDVNRYIFTMEDSHRLLLATVPVHHKPRQADRSKRAYGVDHERANSKRCVLMWARPACILIQDDKIGQRSDASRRGLQGPFRLSNDIMLRCRRYITL